MHLVLASTSPRRKDLLALLQLSFETAAPAFTEHPQQALSPQDHALFFAEGKALSCAGRFPDALVLASDTLIALDGEVLGKPVTPDDGLAMLRRLQGREHEIHTAVALHRQSGGVRVRALESVRVWMQDVSDPEIIAYVQTGEGLDKAGGYAIQGAGGRLIARIDGDFTAAVGLPLKCVGALLRGQGLTLPVNLDALYSVMPYPNWERFATRLS